MRFLVSSYEYEDFAVHSKEWRMWKQWFRDRQTYKRNRPRDRVHRVMQRISRDKWLSPDDVRRIGMNLSWKCSRAGHTVYRAAIPETCECIGMWQGYAPVCIHTQNYEYGKILKLVKTFKNDPISIEIGILRIVVRRTQCRPQANLGNI